MVNDTVDERT
jgi:DNA-binding MarR family transcriptional regulator